MPPFPARTLVTSSTGRRVALAAFDHQVVIHDLVTGVTGGPIETVFAFGGWRLVLSDELDALVAASYERSQVVRYAAESGAKIWSRRDVKRPQRLQLSRDGRKLHAIEVDGLAHLLDLESGERRARIRGVDAIDESPFEPVVLIDPPREGPPRLCTDDGRELGTFAREGFAILDRAFAPGALCVSEVGGSVRCLRVPDLRELWRARSPQGAHVLRVASDRDRDVVVGLEFPYERREDCRLRRWSSDGGEDLGAIPLAVRDEAATFALGGRVLVLADGRVLDTETGAVVQTIV
jgi:hypothetical protein